MTGHYPQPHPLFSGFEMKPGSIGMEGIGQSPAKMRIPAEMRSFCSGSAEILSAVPKIRHK
ncbi:hypothetical protein [Paraburkholderia lycopersici]|uniref:hypothetical protein n=1 Tax=Paraburkholderia lycopersici TaxID=416944 RepID=UPI0011612D4F|nr:hypothetical protein [Paraburkholderia lycopersici]